MELIVFDLDGTLLNRHSALSTGTRDTLAKLADRGIAYTVATGRTLHAARTLLAGSDFSLPHVYKNGVMIWRPDTGRYSHSRLLTLEEIRRVIEAFTSEAVTPFVLPWSRGARRCLPRALRSRGGTGGGGPFRRHGRAGAVATGRAAGSADITNISAIGPRQAIERVQLLVADEPQLMAYSGLAIEGRQLHWIDIHHSQASKGDAIAEIKRDLGVSRVICFGDSDNDLSMFAQADESYAPSNAKAVVKAAATAVIGHHDEDGIARFLQERFQL